MKVRVSLLQYDDGKEVFKVLDTTLETDGRYDEVHSLVKEMYDKGQNKGQSMSGFAAGMWMQSVWYGGVDRHRLIMGVQLSWGKTGSMVANVVRAFYDLGIRSRESEIGVFRMNGGRVEVG